ncbi:hypothetical protein FHW89_004138 [Mucilaginibacter sp. SG564]|nr:hypothetical protein [Mucilaginibacter sp. SG564]
MDTPHLKNVKKNLDFPIENIILLRKSKFTEIKYK